ncbi:glycosyl hydrolase [Paenibacillus aurantiacus]|uniref:Glycosyl hydrolase n=1 Tax=Paenibacillus aurantiacus TaxID=1936118 RepID=A0ABV5KPI3_9BACL
MKIRHIWACLATICLLLVLMPPNHMAAASEWTTFKEAQQLEQQGKYKEAALKYAQVAPIFVSKKEYGNAAQMYRRVGDCYVQLKQYDDAVLNWDQEASYAAKANQTQISLAATRKADQLRSSAKLYVETVSTSGTPYNGTKLVPRNGALIGAYAELDSAVNDPKTGKSFTEQFPLMTGKKHAAYLLYFNYGNNPSILSKHLERAKASGTAIQLGIQPMNGLGEVKDDAYLRELAKALGDSDVPIFLRFANEMNGDWVPWTGNPQLYIEKFRLVANVFREEAKNNVVMVWAPGEMPKYNMTDYYPGDAYVDWVGVSLYSIFNPAYDPLKLGEDRSSHLDKFDQIYKLYASRKPVFISEGAVSYMYPEQKQDKTGWAVYKTKEFYGSLPMVYPNVKGVFWFDSNKDSSQRMKYYMLSANPKLLDAYRTSIASPFYLGSIGEESPIAYKLINNQAIAADAYKLSAYVKTWAPILSKITYTINGQLAGSATAPPWTSSVNLTPYKGQTVKVIVQAYDTTGKRVTTQSVPITVK